MFSKLRSFTERHYRKALVLGALVGGGILLKRFAERKLIEWQEREMSQLLERSRKQQHFESTERTCNMTITSVLPQIQSAIGKSLDSDSITLLLKQKAPNKKDLWEQLKVISFSRLICYIYGNSILTILLRTQVNILGAYLYLANQNPSKPDLELSPEVQSQFLSTSNHWLTVGIEKFCLIVERIVSSQVTTLSLKQRFTLVDLEKTLQNICVALEEELDRQPSGYLSSIVLPHSDTTNTPSSLSKMVRETSEVMDSTEVSRLISSCASVGVTCVLDKFSEIIVSLSDTVQPQENNSFVHPNCFSVHLAKLIPPLNNFIFQDVWPAQLLTVEPLRTFGANIYESFSTL